MNERNNELKIGLVIIGIHIVCILISSIVSHSARADQWLCKEEASQRRGSTITACGIGYGLTEQQARESAFEASKQEFNNICAASSDCYSKQVVVNPKRTDCALDGNNYVCYRLVDYTMVSGAVTGKEASKGFLPRGKIAIGMTKQQVLAVFGTPKSVNKDMFDGGYTVVYVNDNFCNSGFSYIKSCLVHIVNNRVDNYTDFKPQYIEGF